MCCLKICYRGDVKIPIVVYQIELFIEVVSDHAKEKDPMRDVVLFNG